MKKVLIILIILILIIALAVIYFTYSKKLNNPQYKPGSNENNAQGNETKGVTGFGVSEPNNDSSGGSKGGGGGSSSSAGLGEGQTPNTNTNNMPKDLYTAECGYHFESYGVCQGTCPEGTCVNEGRSCYCKKV